MQIGFFNVVEAKIGQLGNFHAGLEKKLNYSGNPDIETDGITQVFDFDRSEDSGRKDVILGVGKKIGRIIKYKVLAMEIFEKSFEGVDFSGNTLGGKVLTV